MSPILSLIFTYLRYNYNTFIYDNVFATLFQFPKKKMNLHLLTFEGYPKNGKF